VWDAGRKGLGLIVQPSGHKSWTYVYSRHGDPQWVTIGTAVDSDGTKAIPLKDARNLATEIMVQVAQGRDPVSERRAKRTADTFQVLAQKYIDEHAREKNRSWEQAAALVKKHLLPPWGKMKASDVKREDLKALRVRLKESPIVFNQTLAAGSAIFKWALREGYGGITANPCEDVQRYETKARERVLFDSEIPIFWKAFGEYGASGVALRMILLSGQRPGEIQNMLRQHVVDGWWQLPGAPDASVGWPGTKNKKTHSVWISAPLRSLLGDLSGTGRVFKVKNLDAVMRKICADMNIADKVTPHDLRRTFLSKVTGLRFGRDAMDRLSNHVEGGVRDTYDRHNYADDNRKVWEAVAAHIMDLIEPKADNVIDLGARR
jgi:integrase